MKGATRLRVLITLALVVLIEFVCRLGLVSPRSLIPPTEMAMRLWQLLQHAEFWEEVGLTARNILIAFIAAVVVGFALGTIIHGLPRVRRAIEPMIASYYALPFFVLYPLFIVLFGMNWVPITCMGFLYAVMAMITGTLGGLDRIPLVLGKVSRTYRLGRVREALMVKLPAAAPYIFTGAKLALGYAITGVIGSEFILSDKGLGYSIAYAYNNFDDRTMYGLLLFVILVVSTLSIVMQWAEDRVQYRSGAGHSGDADRKAGIGERAAAGLVIALVILAIWQALYHKVGQEALASPATTVAKLVALLGRPEFWANVAETASALGLSLLLSCFAGALLGIVIGANRKASEVAEPMLVTLYALPKVTLYPVVLLFFGIGLSAKVAFGALYGMIPMMLITLNAIRNMNPSLRRTAQVLRLSRMQSAFTVMIPATVPEIVTGLRVSFSITLLGVMIGEMFASQRGLGFMIMNSIGVNDTATMMAVTLLIAIFALTVNGGLLALDDRLHRP
jgi:ABC-type nitrate/sulfonate/bicarbonate transport system permease component